MRLIPTSGSSDSKFTSSDDSSTSQGRGYTNRSIRCRLAPAKMLKQIAAVSPTCPCVDRDAMARHRPGSSGPTATD